MGMQAQNRPMARPRERAGWVKEKRSVWVTRCSQPLFFILAMYCFSVMRRPADEFAKKGGAWLFGLRRTKGGDDFGVGFYAGGADEVKTVGGWR